MDPVLTIIVAAITAAVVSGAMIVAAKRGIDHRGGASEKR